MLTIGGLAAINAGLSGCASSNNDDPSKAADNYYHIEASTPLSMLVNHKAFNGGGILLLPWYGTQEGMDEPFENIGRYLIYHSHINTPSMLEAVNHLIDDSASGKQVFYPVYSEDERARNPELEQVGLFYFRGSSGAPFAIINPGGGFAYVGSIHESIPHAHVLSNAGYNAFSLSYRMGSGDKACEDLAAAIAFIFNNAHELEVSTEQYSLWGGSAGARMASMLGSYGTQSFGFPETPKASTIIMAYTGQSSYTPYDPPTYSVVGENDGIASARVMARRIKNLQNAGVPAEIKVFPNLGHGFGLGIGTSAEGWIDDARIFWEQNGLNG